MASTNEILEAVRQRLAALPLAAELWPESHDKYRLNHAVGAALVGYAGARFGDGRAVGVVVQDRDMVIPVILCFRQLNGPSGAIDMLDRARSLLLGFEPPDCGKVLLQAEKFAGEEDRVWWYQLDIACRTVAVEDAEDPDSMGEEDGTEDAENPDAKPVFKQLICEG